MRCSIDLALYRRMDSICYVLGALTLGFLLSVLSVV